MPSAASFYVPQLPDLDVDPSLPLLHVYAGPLSSDPEAARLPATTVSAHLFFVLIKARRVADKERVVFWFNVRLLLLLCLALHAATHNMQMQNVSRVDQGARRSTAC